MRGIILYEDRVRVAILTLRSDNTKTGDMAQAWILSRNVNPFSASITGTDKHVCGDCKHRFQNLGTCYVNLVRAPTSVWEAYHRGLYRPETPKAIRRIRGKEIRLGAYGDPAFVPFEVWRRLLDASSAEHTGYTHQWRSRSCDPRFKQIVMASVDSLAERAEAKALGWRTFRIRNEGEKIVRGEMQCPAAAEAGHAEQCIDCPSKCSGGEGRDAGIIVHGMMRKRFLPVVVS